MALTVAVAAVLLPAVANASPSFTWTGGTPAGIGSSNWSEPTNWEGGAAPSGPAGTLTFPTLTSEACTAMPATDACNQSNNDLPALNVNSISVDDGAGYSISGNAITLGAGGITAVRSTGSLGSNLGLPISLSASQTWSIGGSGSTHGEMFIGGGVTGAADALGIRLGRLAGLAFLGSDNEVGAVSITGENTSETGNAAILNGAVSIGTTSSAGSLNGVNGHSVSVTDAFVAGRGSIGPLTASGADLQVGEGAPTPGTLSVNGGITLNSTSVVQMAVVHSGTTAGTDYSQLSATGSVNLANASLGLTAGGPGDCPTLTPGVDTLITTSGTLGGTFAGIPNGAVVGFGFVSPCAPQSARAQINYSAHGVTATIQQPEEEERKRREEEAAAKKRQEEEAAAQKRREEEAAGRKHQEEEAAAMKIHEEEAAANKRVEEEAAAKRHREEEAAAKIPAPPTGVNVQSGSNSATVRWQEIAPAGGITGFRVREVRSDGSSPAVVASTGASSTSVQIFALRNCQPIRFEVQATSVSGDSGWSAPTTTAVPHESSTAEPKVAVILMEGVDSESPNESYYAGPSPSPGLPGIASYCRVTDGGGPTVFPTSLTSLMDNYNPGFDSKFGLQLSAAPTSMTDRLVSHNGTVLLPWSFGGVWLQQVGGGTLVHVNASSPQEADNTAPDTDAATLEQEVSSVHTAWPRAKIAILSHSLGGLIGEQYWEYYWRGDHQGVSRIISLDGAINGVADERALQPCTFIPVGCFGVGPLGPELGSFFGKLWGSIGWHDPAISANDGDGGFLPVGTEGDSAYAPYDAGVDPLVSQLLFNCQGLILQTCDLISPAVVSPCPSPNHAMVKACPAVIDYVEAAIFGSASASIARTHGARARLASSTSSSSDLTAGVKHQLQVPLLRIIAGQPWAVSVNPAAAAGALVRFNGAHLGASAGTIAFSAGAGRVVPGSIVGWGDSGFTARIPVAATSGPVLLRTVSGKTISTPSLAILGASNGADALSAQPTLTMTVGRSARLTVFARRKGRPVAGSIVSVLDGGKVQSVRADRRGRAKLTIASDLVGSVVAYSGGVWRVVKVRWTSAVASITLTAQVRRTRTGRSLTVTARTRDSRGRAVPGVPIRFGIITPRGSSEGRATRANHMGRTTLRSKLTDAGTLITAGSEGTTARLVLH